MEQRQENPQTKQDETSLMNEQEFKDYIDNSVNLLDFSPVHKFKSVLRAFRRGHITKYGMIIPKRPFNNRANTSKRKGVHSRSTNEFKRKRYAEILGRLNTQ